ncbi:MAG TPA: transposase [Terriglobales bacterium]|nr:transposase [Terriglobales bacterium]
MPRRLRRYQQTGPTHFLTCSCYRRAPRLQVLARYDLFVRKLEQTRCRFGFHVYGYVVMPEHVHLLLSEPDRGSLAAAIQSLKLSVTRSIPGLGVRTVEPARLWEKRYYDRNIRDHKEFVEKLRYIHRNPVQRGLVERPEEWPWSSFRHYATGEAGVVEIESEWTAGRRPRRS